jgi:hypothetical protein
VRRSVTAVALAARAAALILVTAGAAGLAACSAGGAYEPSARRGGEVDRGETNGRMLDFVSNKPDGDDWQIRIRDSSMWVAYATGTELTELGTVNLDEKETRKLWNLIDEIDIGGRKKGTQDEDEGYVQLRLREPGGDEGHELTTIFVSRSTEDEAILDLGAYLQKLIMKYLKKEADF